MDALFGGPVTTTRPGMPSEGGVRHDHVARVVQGTYPSPNYLSATPGQFGLFDAGPTVKSIDDVPFMLILPTGTTGPVPVAIFQHGINGDRSTMLLVADDYAARGYATFGIDIPWHGSRAKGAVDELTNLSGAPGPDGIGDLKGRPVAAFFDFNGDPAAGIAALDPRVMRDNFRQATVDLMQAARLAAGGDWSEVPELALDGSQVVYTAVSFGSILGANVLAVDPTVKVAVLAAPGAGLFLDTVPSSATLGPLLPSLFADLLDHAVDVDHPEASPPRAQMSLALLQTLFEPGDGLALAGEAPPDKSVLFLEAFNDEVVPNHAAESLAAAWGASQVSLAGSPPARIVPLPEVSAPYEGAALRALVQLTPATHGFYTYQDGERTVADGGPPFVAVNPPLAVDNPIERSHALALDFMISARQGTPIVRESP
jgi:dienelactone hydrolase